MSALPDFFWVGNHLALDFVNTLLAGPEGPVDLLRSDADLWRWARASELGPRARPARAPARELDPAVTRLRAALGALFRAAIDSRAPPRAALAEVNAALAQPPPDEPLAFAAGRFRRARAPLTTNAELLRHLAERAAELLERGTAGRLRRCEGAGCVLLFLDVSKTGRRRWCSMEGCGNRAKARAHYGRLRKKS